MYEKSPDCLSISCASGFGRPRTSSRHGSIKHRDESLHPGSAATLTLMYLRLRACIHAATRAPASACRCGTFNTFATLHFINFRLWSGSRHSRLISESVLWSAFINTNQYGQTSRSAAVLRQGLRPLPMATTEATSVMLCESSRSS